jgi:ParB family transcriptional regulator, chromosome partitioning protein
MTVHVTDTITQVALNKLVLSDKNVRRSATTPEQDAELAASILSQGLKQNLVVSPCDDGETYAVAAGGRRLKALQTLAGEGAIAADFPVRCLVEAPELGAETSLVENAVRAQMHPAEEFEAFRDLIQDQDWSREAVAQRFGVTLRRVDQRLKLAAIAPEIIDAWKQGALTQAQVEAFALTDDHERQRSYFEDSTDWSLKPEAIRRAMLVKAMQVGKDKLASFVGREDYEAAGGDVTTDLFEDAAFLNNAELVQELADKKLRMLADEIVEREGWAWGQAATEFGYRVFEKHGRIYGKTIRDPERDRLAEVVKDAQAAYDGREHEIAEGFTDEETGEVDQEAYEAATESDAALESLAAAIEAAHAALKAYGDGAGPSYEPAEKALSGIAVSLDHDGKLEIRRGLVHPDQLPQLKELQDRQRIRDRLVREQAAQQEADDGSDRRDAVDIDDGLEEHDSGREDGQVDGRRSDEDLDAAVEAELEAQRRVAAERRQAEAEHAAEMRGDLSAALVGSLTLERTAAIRAEVAMQPGLALRLVAYQCALRARKWPRDHAPVIGIEIKSAGLGSHDDGPAGEAYRGAVEDLAKQLPDDPVQLWDHVMAADDADLLTILAIGVAGTLDLHIPGPQETYRVKRNMADRLAQAAGLDMREWWRADEAFFERVTKGVMLDALRESAPVIRDLADDKARDLAIADLARQPKAELVKTTAQALEGTGWLPKPLRTKGIATVGDADTRDDNATTETANAAGDPAIGESQAAAGDPDRPGEDGADASDDPPWFTDDEDTVAAGIDHPVVAAADAGASDQTQDATAPARRSGKPRGRNVKPVKATVRAAKADRKMVKGATTRIAKSRRRSSNGAAHA